MMTVRNISTTIHSTCRHCGELWGIGEDYKRVLALLPSPRKTGKYRIPCLNCGKKNVVTVKVTEAPK